MFCSNTIKLNALSDLSLIYIDDIFFLQLFSLPSNSGFFLKMAIKRFSAACFLFSTTQYGLSIPFIDSSLLQGLRFWMTWNFILASTLTKIHNRSKNRFMIGFFLFPTRPHYVYSQQIMRPSLTLPGDKHWRFSNTRFCISLLPVNSSLVLSYCTFGISKNKTLYFKTNFVLAMLTVIPFPKSAN